SQQGVVEINPRTRKVVKTLGLGFAPSHLAVGGGSLWATSGRSGTVMAIDLRSGTHGDAIQLPGVNGGLASADGIAVSAGRVFVYDRSDLALFTVNPRTEEARRVPSATVGGDLATPIAVRATALWYLCCRNTSAQLERLDLRAGVSQAFDLGGGLPTYLAL